MPEEKIVTMQSTKKEMLEAYQELAARLDEAKKNTQAPIERATVKESREAVKTADASSATGVSKEISNLKFQVGQMLGELSDKLEAELSRYEKVTKAVAEKEKEIVELFEIEKTASSLVALLETQREKKEAFEMEMKARTAELESEIQQKSTEWKEKIRKNEEDQRDATALEKKKREREAEEFRYQFEREKSLAQERLKDETAQLEKELARKKQEAEANFAAREKALAEAEQELAALRKKAATFDGELALAVDRAVKRAVAEEKKDAENRIALLTREFEGERGVLQSRLASLESSLKDQAARIERLNAQVEKSYTQVRDMALKALESSSGRSSLRSADLMASADAARRTAQPNGE